MRDARLTLYARTWEDYLARLDELSPVAPDVRRVWASLGDRLWAPEAAPTTEGFRLAWDRGAHHLQIEIFPGGLFDWFYRNRDEDATQFEENLRVDQPSEVLDAVISRLAAA